MIPHPEKVHKGGEDALFADKKILVVADGVGGWAEVIYIIDKLNLVGNRSRIV